MPTRARSKANERPNDTSPPDRTALPIDSRSRAAVRAAFALALVILAAWIATAQHEAVPIPAAEEVSTATTPEPQQTADVKPNVVPEAVAARSANSADPVVEIDGGIAMSGDEPEPVADDRRR